MNRVNGIVNKTTLGALLGIQVVIVGVLLAARSGGIEEPEPFLEFDAGIVDSLIVSNRDGSVSLAKVDGAWQLPNEVPAATMKVDTVLEKLAKASGGWPVANTGSTRERFEVTEDNHQRHILVKAGEDTLADIYLGTSPGYRKTHARRSEDDEVYAIGFSNYEAGVKSADWLDRSLLRPTGDVAAVRRLPGGFIPAGEPDSESEDESGDDEAVVESDSQSEDGSVDDEVAVEPVAEFAFSKDDEGGWVSADGKELDQGKVETFVGRFKGLSVTGVSEATLPDAATMAFVLTDEDGDQTLSVFALDDGEKYVAVSDRLPGAYELSKYIAEQMNTPLADLAPDAPSADEQSDAPAETATAEESGDSSGEEASAAETGEPAGEAEAEAEAVEGDDTASEDG